VHENLNFPARAVSARECLVYLLTRPRLECALFERVTFVDFTVVFIRTRTG